MLEQVFSSIFIMGLVNLAEILGSRVAVVELENFFRRDDGIKVTEDKKNREMGI